jgi:signal transduction histidine kinase
MSVKSALAGAAVLAALFIGLQLYGAAQHRKGYDQAQAEYMIAVAHAEGRARQIEHELTEEMEARDRDTQEKLAQIALAERRAADERVRQSAQEYAARYRRDTALASATAERQAADTAIRMFAELLSQTDDLAGIYAAEADRRRIAGLSCEAAYTDARGR